MTNSRRKGKAGELEAAKAIQELFRRGMRRSQQFCGRAGDADIVGIDGIHFEVKRVERLNLYQAMAQARADAPGGVIPTVLWRRNNSPWLLTVELEALPKLVSILGGQRDL